MVTNSTCAVVITFHPDTDVLENLSKLRGQVQGLVVVDNGSPAAAISLLRIASSQLGFQLVENGENLGIATALNIGVHWAESHSYQWVIFFDQDSAVTDGFMDTMLHAFENSPRGDRLAILVPHYVDKRSGSDLPAISVRTGGLETAMTSGTLMRVSSFQQHGKFEEDLFIDAVDYEFSLRLRSNGYFIEECNQAVLLHAPGAPKVHKLWGMYLFQTANYSPVRRYYQERNKVWVARRYWRRFPFFCMKLFVFSLKDCAKGILAESRKWDKFYHASAGIADGFRGRMGRFNRI
jgi:rhamnosyltransferase